MTFGIIFGLGLIVGLLIDPLATKLGKLISRHKEGQQEMKEEEFNEYLGKVIAEYFEVIKIDTFKNTKEFIQKQRSLYAGLINVINNDPQKSEKIKNVWVYLMSDIFTKLTVNLLPFSTDLTDLVGLLQDIIQELKDRKM